MWKSKLTYQRCFFLLGPHPTLVSWHAVYASVCLIKWKLELANIKTMFPKLLIAAQCWWQRQLQGSNISASGKINYYAIPQQSRSSSPTTFFSLPFSIDVTDHPRRIFHFLWEKTKPWFLLAVSPDVFTREDEKIHIILIERPDKDWIDCLRLGGLRRFAQNYIIISVVSLSAVLLYTNVPKQRATQVDSRGSWQTSFSLVGPQSIKTGSVTRSFCLTHYGALYITFF